MPAEYLLNLGVEQLYFDAEGKRCKPPGSCRIGHAMTIHFVQVVGDYQLLAKGWNIGPNEILALQRGTAKIYKKDC